MKLNLSVEVPIRLVSVLNAREYWRARAKRTKDQRAGVGLLLQAHAPPGMRGILARTPTSMAWVHLTRVAPGRLDGDNLQGACKAVRDEIADFLGLDDRNDDRFTWVYEQARAKEYAVQIAIEVTL